MSEFVMHCTAKAILATTFILWLGCNTDRVEPPSVNAEQSLGKFVASNDEGADGQLGQSSGESDPDVPSAADLVLSVEPGDELPGRTPSLVQQTDDLARLRQERNETVWAKERLAQEYEAALVALWDALLRCDRSGGDKFHVFKELGFSDILIGEKESESRLDLDIVVVDTQASAEPLDRSAWSELLDRWREAGYRLVQSEWHHAAFEPATEDAPAHSQVAIVLHVLNDETKLRLAIEGKVGVTWKDGRGEDRVPVPDSVDASELKILSREGEPIFQKWLIYDPRKEGKPAGIHPLLLHDLNGDGLSEIVAGGCNQVFWNEGESKFRGEEFCTFGERTFEVGVLADVTGDGAVDYVAPGMRGDLLLFAGDEQGRFTTRPIGKARGGGPLRQPQALTAGDVDADGDLDLFLGQYKISYVGGQMPSPYYDANDGFPAFLLLNDGQGRFSPATEEAGLAEKRNRRTYTASLADLDNDADLDLLVVSDFAGIDVYNNDGKGYFSDVTSDAIKGDWRLFGMSATFGDYNRDGRLDFYVAGMASTTARRLEQMKLGRRDRPEVHLHRMRMGYGNRMYVAVDGGYDEPAFRDQVARTGWTWGTTTLDFDNDGDRDLFVANGHSSGQSTKDHCTHFWCHDIYDGDSRPNLAMEGLFRDVHQGYFDRSESWDGYQKNQLLMNLGGEGFRNVAFLLGVADQFDGRAALSDDLDADGRVDLLVVEDRWTDGQILHVYRNTMENSGNWIGIRLRDVPDKPSPIGARVTVAAGGVKHIGQYVTGETIHGQHAPTLHFGLGEAESVESIEITWPNGGGTRKIESPAVNQYHDVTAP